MNDLAIIFISIIYLLLCATNIQAIDYSDLQVLGVACQGRDSCAQISENAEFLERNCECDHDCSEFKDCCIDASTSDRIGDMRVTCMGFGGGPILGAYVINKCAQGYTGSDDIKNKCENQNDFSDPFAAAPVTSTTGRTYRNRYCVECNNASSTTLRSWAVLIACETLALYNVNDSFAWENIEYRADIKEWGVQFQDEFHYCDILFDKPEYLSSKVRLCRANTISTCPSTFDGRIMRQECESYTAVVRAKNRGKERFYRNPHCALCNGERIRSLKCLLDGIHLRRKKPFSFAMILDVNRSNGDIVGEVQKCPSDEAYDPFFKKCRPLKCVIPGRTMVDGKCVKTGATE